MTSHPCVRNREHGNLKMRFDMKRFINISAVFSFAVLLAGCADSTVGPDTAKAIRFSTAECTPGSRMPAGTRTPDAPPSPEVFGPGDAIGVFACHSSDPAASFKADFMRNQPVTFDGSVWTYSPVKYWPSNGNVRFRAYFPYSDSYDSSGDGLLTISHECKTGLEPLYASVCTVKAENGSLSGDGIGENGNLLLRFSPLLNKVNFTANADDDLFDEVESDKFKDCRFLIKEFRVWGFYRKGRYSMADESWRTVSSYMQYRRENPLELALDLEDVEKAVPGYHFDVSAGYCTREAVVLEEGAKAKNILGKSAYFIPMDGVIPGNDPGFEVVYVVLTNTADSHDYKESGIVTRSGSLRDIFAGQSGLIKKIIHINLEFSVDGVTVTRDLEDYIYKEMF